jgi:hypothetical protein
MFWPCNFHKRAEDSWTVPPVASVAVGSVGYGAVDYRISSAKPRPSGRGYARQQGYNRNLQVARRRTVVQANRVNSQSEDSGSIPADTDGSTPTTGKPGGESVVRTRSPSSHYPYPSLETVGNDRANEGATAHQNTPHSRLHSALVGGVRSMARPVSTHCPKVGGCPVFGRLGSGGIGYGTSGYRAHLGRTNTPDPRFEGRRVAHEPGTLHTGRGSCLRGQTERPDAPRRNPRRSRRGGCQVQSTTAVRDSVETEAAITEVGVETGSSRTGIDSNVEHESVQPPKTRRRKSTMTCASWVKR